MRIGITTGGCDPRSGMSRYISHLLEAFDHLAADVDFELLLPRTRETDYLPKPLGIHTVYHSELFTPAVANLAWHQTILPWICWTRSYDVVFLPAANRRLAFSLPCPSVGTVHDLTSLHIEGKYDRARMFYQARVIPRLVRRLTRTITISESTRSDIALHCGIPRDAIDLIHSAADTERFRPIDPEIATRRVRALGIRVPYVVYVSRIEHPGKNHFRLIRAFEQAKAVSRLPHQLVMIGADWNGADVVHEAARASSVAGDILLPGYVAEEELPYVYNAADAMIFPSLFEGFGMPILEAMACGTPVACSDVSSMPEIAGGAALLFDPSSEDSISAALEQLLSNPTARARHAERGLARSREFSWERTARETLRVLLEAAERKVPTSS